MVDNLTKAANAPPTWDMTSSKVSDGAWSVLYWRCVAIPRRP